MGKKKESFRRILRFFQWIAKSIFIFALRVFLLFSMGVILLGTAIWCWFLYSFNAQHLSEVITKELQQRLDRPVMISSLDLAFVNTVELKGFTVIDTEGEAGKALVSAESVTLKFRLLPLLEDQLIIDEVTFNEPRFNVVRSEKQYYNVPRLNTEPTSSVYTSRSGKQFTLHVNNWTVKNGTISYKDLKNGTSHALYGVNLHFEQLRLNELSRFTVSMIARNQWEGNISDLEVEGAGHVNLADFDWAKFALRSFRAKAYLFKKPLEIVMDLDNLRTPFFNVKVDVPAFDSEDISLYTHSKLDFSVPASAVSVQGRLENNYQKVIVTQSSLSASDFKANATGTFNFSQGNSAADVTLSTNLFKLEGKEKFWPVLKPYKLTGLGSFTAHLTREKDHFSLPLFTAKTQEASGQIYTFPVEKITGEFQAKDNFNDLYAHITSGAVQVDRSTFDKLDMSASWRKGNLYANIASADLNTIPFKMNLSIDKLKNKNRKIRTNIYWKHLDPMAFIGVVQDFVTAIVPLVKEHTPDPEVQGELAWLRNFRDRLPTFMPNFAGTLSSETFASDVLSGNHFDGEFDFTGLKKGASHLNGTLDVRLQNGVIHQMEKWAEEQQALNVTFQPFIIMNRMERAGSFKIGKVLKDVPFDELAGSARFENGRMEINNAYAVGPTISAVVSGWTDWVNETFDLTIFTMFTNTSRGSALAENLTDESGNPALGFRAYQSMLKPKVDMLRAKKAGQTIRSAQEKGLATDFKTARDFLKGEFHAKK